MTGNPQSNTDGSRRRHGKNLQTAEKQEERLREAGHWEMARNNRLNGGVKDGDKDALQDRRSPEAPFIHIRIGSLSHNAAFFLGLLLGGFVFRVDLVSPIVQKGSDLALGYEYDWGDHCIIMRSKKRDEDDWCRDPVDCRMCEDVTSIDVIHASDMSPELFLDEYAYTGRPVLVKNVTHHWRAMETFNFEFFRDLYLDLDSPVLDNKEEDCQFFAWDFAEFASMWQVFKMNKNRSSMAEGYKPWYIGWANCDKQARQTLEEHYGRPEFLPDGSDSGRRDWFFMGTPGYGAPFHIDTVDYPSWQAQLTGTKQWSLKAPPECWWTCHMQEMNATLEPGDVIAVNTNWWFHSTSVQEEQLSITVTNEYTEI